MVGAAVSDEPEVGGETKHVKRLIECGNWCLAVSLLEEETKRNPDNAVAHLLLVCHCISNVYFFCWFHTAMKCIHCREILPQVLLHA